MGRRMTNRISFLRHALFLCAFSYCLRMISAPPPIRAGFILLWSFVLIYKVGDVIVELCAREDQSISVFTNKSVTVVTDDGCTIRGKLEGEFDEARGFIVLKDAEVTESNIGDTSEIRDYMGINLGLVSRLHVEDLDRPS